MRSVLGLLALYIMFNLGLVAVGGVVGYLLHRMLPSIDLGMGILIGVVSTGFSIHYFIRLLQFAEFLEPPHYEGDDGLPPIRVYPLASPRSGRKRKRT